MYANPITQEIWNLNHYNINQDGYKLQCIRVNRAHILADPIKLVHKVSHDNDVNDDKANM